MRLMGIILLILTGLGHANAQQHYYIYIQSDNQQPFFSRIGKEVYSSSASGYVIIPKLRDSAYQVTVGFPEDRWPEYTFNCIVNKKDRGYLLKNFNEKGWGLFNLQTMEVTMGVKVEEPAEQKSNSQIPPTNDEFTVILAAVVDDPQLRQTELIQKDELNTAVAKQEIRKPEEIKKESEIPRQTVAAADPKKNNEVVSDKETIRKQESSPVQEGVAKDIETKPETETALKPKPDQIDSSLQAQVKKLDTTLASPGSKKETVPVTDTSAQPEANDMKVIGNPDRADSSKGYSAVLFTKVSRTLQYQNKEGMEMIYVDDLLDGNKDTIRIFIPVESVSASQTASTVEVTKNIAAGKKDSQFLDMAIAPRNDVQITETNGKTNFPEKSNAVKNDSIQQPRDTIKQIKEEVASTEIVTKDTATKSEAEEKPDIKTVDKKNSNCAKLATDKDVNLLKSRMIVMTDDDEIVNLALKTFKQKCFTADKIRTLCYVFITDKGKYKLMDAAYPYVYDQENFTELAYLLTDTYYVNRFNALVRKD